MLSGVQPASDLHSNRKWNSTRRSHEVFFKIVLQGSQNRIFGLSDFHYLLVEIFKVYKKYKLLTPVKTLFKTASLLPS